MPPEDKIIAAIDRNTDAIRAHTTRTERNELFRFPVMVSIATSLIMMACCPPAKASPITHAPIAEQPMQYWHTQWVPTDGGVYPQEVYAPALPQVEPEPYVFVDIGDPPRLMETPEPETWWLVGFVILITICIMILKDIAMASMREWELGAKRCARYRLALEQIAATNTDNGMIARKALEETK